jgi:hypothetical protein
LLKDIFRPRRLRGFDVNPSLVKRAKQRGIRAEVKDLEKDLPSGDLAVMWGVLHHLKDCETCIKRIKENYTMAFIREPLKKHVVNGFEIGKPFKKEDIESIVEKHLKGARIMYYNHSVFIFYAAPKSGKTNSNKPG